MASLFEGRATEGVLVKFENENMRRNCCLFDKRFYSCVPVHNESTATKVSGLSLNGSSGDTGSMGRYYSFVQSQQVNPEFASLVPTNGYGDVEARVYKSIAATGLLPRPLSPQLPSRNTCKIFSPVSSSGRAVMLVGRRKGNDDHAKNHGQEYSRKERESHTDTAATPAARPGTADRSYSCRRCRTPTTSTNQEMSAGRILESEGSSPNGNVAAAPVDFNNRRPNTSNSSSRALHRSRFDEKGRALAVNEGRVLSRPSTSGGGGLRHSGSSSGADQQGQATVLSWGFEEGNQMR